jgi:hypothetical protein
MSAAARVAGKVHKWLALLLAIQILFWIVSGLFFAIVPIEMVRSEHVKATIVPAPVSVQVAAAEAAASWAGDIREEQRRKPGTTD